MPDQRFTDPKDVTEPRHVAVVEMPGGRESTRAECEAALAECEEELEQWPRDGRMRRHLMREIAAWQALAARATH